MSAVQPLRTSSVTPHDFLHIPSPESLTTASRDGEAGSMTSQLRYLTYERTDLKVLALDKLARSYPLDFGRHEHGNAPTPPSPLCSMGFLDRLPTELLHIVLLDLDLESMHALRTVNRGVRHVIDNLPQYRAVVTLAPNALRAASSVGLASSILYRNLHDALRAGVCGACGDFGPFLYLLSCSRACILCLAHNPRFQPLTPSDAKAMYGLDDQTVSSLPTLSAPPVIQSGSQEACQRRTRLVDRDSAEKAGIRLHGSMQAMRNFAEKLDSQAKLEYEQQQLLYANLGTAYRPSNYIPRPPDRAAAKRNRFMGVIRFPYLNNDTRLLEWGLSCTGCLRENQLSRQQSRLVCPRTRDWRRMFTTQGYLDHLAECEQSRSALRSLRSS